MTPLELVLSRLDHPREVAPDRWRACCPAHDGKNRTTLAVTQRDDGAVLICCHAGCEREAIVHAMGLDWPDLFPPKPAAPGGGAAPMRHPFVPAQVFHVARQEIGVVAVIAADMQQHKVISEEDWQRLARAARTLDDIADATYARH